MNIFKKKLEQATPVKLPIDPIDLFQSLFHKEGYSYLRGIQEEVLTEWHKIRDQRDVLCKMNTGSGKTLVSLLMLYSKMQEGVGSGLYLCPDKQLLEQARQQAELYGIPVCEIEKINGKNVFPADFLNNKSILLCTFQKLFNGKSIFDRDNITIGAIVIDDAHTCLDIARTETTINLGFDHDISARILKIFDKDLKHQAPGTYHRLLSGDPYASILKVPYWAWYSKKDELVNLLGSFHDDSELLFKWGLIADDLLSYDCYVGPKGIQFAPIHVPYYNVRAFDNAKHRYILSATFEDQIDLVKDFGIDVNSIINSLVPRDRKDLGQRLVLAPKRYDPSIKDESILELAVDYAKKINVVILVPSTERAKIWKKVGGIVLNDGDINSNIDNLKTKSGGLYILINRYDGVDLNGDMCRLLIVDGYPAFTSYKELYSEMRLESMRASLKAQIIEQGLGRAVRSGSDYCVIYLVGNDLLQFLGNNFNLQYFTPTTRKHLEMGLTLLDEESKTDSLNIIQETGDFCLSQSNEWRAYHSQEISSVESEGLSEEKIKSLNIAQIEKEAIDLFRGRNYSAASETILTNIIDGDFGLTNKQKGWYFQLAAQFLYLENVSKSNDLQLKACELAPHMLQSKIGGNYTKINASEEQSSNVIRFLSQFNKSQDFRIYIEELLDKLQFSPDIHSSKFENSLANVGKILGFHSQEPESEYGNGPDVLWVMSDNHYLILEAKSMAIHDEITRDNIGQLLQSGEWFKKTYGSENFTLVTLQPPSVKGWNVNPSENTRVIDEKSLEEIKNNLSQFTNALAGYGIMAVTKEQVKRLLGIHNFTPTSFREKYLKKINIKKK